VSVGVQDAFRGACRPAPPLAAAGPAGHGAPPAPPGQEDPLSFAALTESMVMVMIAEMGDRSQIACMVLGSRTRPWPVLLGAIAAFIVLDGLAMLLGGGLGALLPPRLLAGLAAALFLGFGVQAWRSRDAAEEEDAAIKDPHKTTARAIFALAFATLVVAEFGDKTWIAVGARSAVGDPIAVWIGATLGLSITSAIGVLAGKAVLSRLPPRTLRTATALIFSAMGLLALARAAGLGLG
jgi:putative Ca2+/H+ antiporter (TMEM165/GDT1 family)